MCVWATGVLDSNSIRKSGENIEKSGVTPSLCGHRVQRQTKHSSGTCNVSSGFASGGGQDFLTPCQPASLTLILRGVLLVNGYRSFEIKRSEATHPR